mgnify:FL=1
MAKQTSLFGKISGKLGAVVFSTSGGETISREYNPNVSNPNTQAQINQRARLKLMSQLSAALSPVLAFTKTGLVSKRNKFTKVNFPATYVQDGQAQITYENVQITEGNTALPAIFGVGDPNGDDWEIRSGFRVEPSATIKRVVFCLFKKSLEGKLEYITSQIVTERNFSEPGVYFAALFDNLEVAEYVVFAYGMSDQSDRATAQYGNLNVVTASDLARLVATRSLSFSDYQFTQTRSITIKRDGSSVEPESPGKIRVFVTALGNGGTVSGGGSYDPGTSVTVVATPATGMSFDRWVKNGTNQTISTQASYTFVVTEQMDLVAVFSEGNNDSL